MRASGVFLCMGVTFVACMYYLLNEVAALGTSSMPSAQLNYPAARDVWLVIASFAGMGIALMSVTQLMMHWWPADTRWYSTYLSIRRYQCDYERLCRGLGFAFALGAISFVPFALNWHAQVLSDSFVTHPFFGFHEVSHSFADIKQIDTAPEFTAPNGRTRHDRDFIVRFKDGSNWVASELPSGNYTDREKVAFMLSIESGVPIREVPIFRSSDLSFLAKGESATEASGRTAPVWMDDVGEALEQAVREEATGKLSRAERDFSLAASWVPDDPATVGQLGQFYVTSAKWDKAWSIADRLIESHPESPWGWVLRAMVQKLQPRAGLHETDEYIVGHFSADPDMRGNVEQARADLKADGAHD